ncbi:uncharacterized protein LOC118202718 [Stegodyphus dumicola]|uniref:uncharacterized protein LOC118202718 n=1 Tax=Stegodyphus dumicola TaxID=202533 RepID=UPI0015A7EB7E|nr:uncharacterized protein LOC118202718 [Stegodyphus dumicola]
MVTRQLQHLSYFHTMELSTFIALYNPPNNLLDIDKLAELLPNNKHIILAGDLNSKNTEWGCRRTNNAVLLEVLLEFINNYPIYFYAPTDYTYLPDNPRRGDILDIVLTNTSIPMYLDVKVELTSDHVPVIAILGTNRCDDNKFKRVTDWQQYYNQLLENPQLSALLGTKMT